MIDVFKRQMRDGASELALGPFLFSLVLISRAERALDVGTGTGMSAISMALAMRELHRGIPTIDQHRDCRGGGPARFPTGRPYVTTIELPGFNHPPFHDQVGALDLSGYIEAVKQDCFEYARTHRGETVDIAFLDATKTFEEAAAFVPFVRPDGFVVLHDMFGDMSQCPFNGPVCERLDLCPKLEGTFFDTGFMSFKCYRVRSRVGEGDL